MFPLTNKNRCPKKIYLNGNSYLQIGLLRLCELTLHISNISSIVNLYIYAPIDLAILLDYWTQKWASLKIIFLPEELYPCIITTIFLFWSIVIPSRSVNLIVVFPFSLYWMIFILLVVTFVLKANGPPVLAMLASGGTVSFSSWFKKSWRDGSCDVTAGESSEAKTIRVSFRYQVQKILFY